MISISIVVRSHGSGLELFLSYPHPRLLAYSPKGISCIGCKQMISPFVRYGVSFSSFRPLQNLILNDFSATIPTLTPPPGAITRKIGPRDYVYQVGLVLRTFQDRRCFVAILRCRCCLESVVAQRSPRGYACCPPRCTQSGKSTPPRAWLRTYQRTSLAGQCSSRVYHSVAGGWRQNLRKCQGAIVTEMPYLVRPHAIQRLPDPLDEIILLRLHRVGRGRLLNRR